MAGKAKSLYVTIATKGNPFDVKVRKQFFNAKAYREWVKEVIAEYPEDKFRYTKETY